MSTIPQIITLLEQQSNALGQAIHALKGNAAGALRVAQDDADKRKRQSAAMKRRWREAKKAGKTRL
jgi:hypothetical protein